MGHIILFMIQTVITGLALLGIMALLRWLFSPYFNWKSQRKIAASKANQVKVLFQQIEYDYKVFKNPQQVKLSIIIPAYNEEKRLGYTLQETLKYFRNYSYEVIVVNDASKDKTLDVARSFMDQNFKIVTYNVNRGKGGAVRLGMLIANGDFHLMMDADLATDLADYPKVERELQQIQRNGLALVTGSRNQLGQGVEVQRKWYRGLLGFVSNFIIQQICGIKLKDTQCGFKLMTRNTSRILFRILHLERWAFDVELFMIGKHYNAPFSEVPVRWHDVEGSHLGVVEASLTMARDFVLVRLLYLMRIWRYDDDIGL